MTLTSITTMSQSGLGRPYYSDLQMSRAEGFDKYIFSNNWFYKQLRAN